MTEVRPAALADADVIARLAAELAQSFAFRRVDFDLSYPALLADRDAFERWAAPFYLALGYAESASYLRKVLSRQAAP